MQHSTLPRLIRNLRIQYFRIGNIRIGNIRIRNIRIRNIRIRNIRTGNFLIGNLVRKASFDHFTFLCSLGEYLRRGAHVPCCAYFRLNFLDEFSLYS